MKKRRWQNKAVQTAVLLLFNFRRGKTVQADRPTNTLWYSMSPRRESAPSSSGWSRSGSGFGVRAAARGGAERARPLTLVRGWNPEFMIDRGLWHGRTKAPAIGA